MSKRILYVIHIIKYILVKNSAAVIKTRHEGVKVDNENSFFKLLFFRVEIYLKLC